MNVISKAGFSATYRDDGIWHYHFSDISRATVDAWIEFGLEQDKEALVSGEHLLRLTTTNVNLLPTPYALAKATATTQNPLDILVSEAYVVGNQIAYHLVSVSVMSLQNHAIRASTRIFQHEAEAIAWLLQRRTEAPSK